MAAKDSDLVIIRGLDVLIVGDDELIFWKFT